MLASMNTLGIRLKTATPMARGHDDDRTPSLRYLALLREGARAYGLPAHYIQFLEQVDQGHN